MSWPEQINGVPVPYGLPVSCLRDLLDDPSMTWVACRALAARGDEESLTVLRDLAGRPPVYRRRTAVEYIGLHAMWADAVDTITAALSDESEIVARTAAEVVENRQLVAAHAQTMRLTVSRDPRTRKAGVRALTCIAQPTDMAAAVALYTRDPSVDVRKEAGYWVYAAATQSTWRVAYDTLKGSPIPRERGWACEILAIYGCAVDAGAPAELERFLADPDGHVRKRAACLIAIDPPSERMWASWPRRGD